MPVINPDDKNGRAIRESMYQEDYNAGDANVPRASIDDFPDPALKRAPRRQGESIFSWQIRQEAEYNARLHTIAEQNWP